MNQRVRKTMLGSELEQQEGDQASQKEQRWGNTANPCVSRRFRQLAVGRLQGVASVVSYWGTAG